VEEGNVTSMHSHDPSETMEIGARIGGLLPSGAVVLFMGPLGSGKTTLAKGIARGLGIRDEIISPTYTMVAEYSGIKTLYHIDLYRIEGKEQMDSLALDDVLWGDGVSVIEWGEKLEIDFPHPPVRITLSIDSESERTITVEGMAI
jgi:tRNA threonylcarbamoyladenosine biosynthesis protein TsaE